MIFENFPARSISAWKIRRRELGIHVQEAEHTGDGVEVASLAIADQLVRCECAVKRLGANLDKLRQVAQGLILNQPTIPQVCNISNVRSTSLPLTSEAAYKSRVEGQAPYESPNDMHESYNNPVELAYAIADLANQNVIKDQQKNRLRAIIESRERTALQDVCLVWIILSCMLGESRDRHSGSAVAQVYFSLARNKLQSTSVLSHIFARLVSEDCLGVLKLQVEAQSAFGPLTESAAPNKWIAVSLCNDLLKMHILDRLLPLSTTFRQRGSDPHDVDLLTEACKKWIEETERELSSATIFRLGRDELMTSLLTFLVKLEIPALPLYKCASLCASPSQLLTPTLISTCSESMANDGLIALTNCQSVTELYSLFLRRFCTFVVECDDPAWRELILAGAAVFYSKLIKLFVPSRLELAIYSVAFVNVALESLLPQTREHVEILRPVSDAFRAMGRAFPKGFDDKRIEVVAKLMGVCAVCSPLLTNSHDVASVVKKSDCSNDIGDESHEILLFEKPPLPEIYVNRSILDLAQGEAPVTSPTSNEPGVTASPALTTRFSFDNLLGGGSGSRETAVAAFVGKWTAWGRRA